MTLRTWLFDPPGLSAHGWAIAQHATQSPLHVWSNLVVALAFFSVPFAYAAFLRRRPDMPFRWVGWLFSAFLVARGVALCLPLLAWWMPLRRLEDGFAVATAALAVAATILLWRLIPKVAARPSGGELTGLNAVLAAKIAEHADTAVRLRVSEARVRLANIRLERGVAERTAELVENNARLTDALQVAAHAVEDFRVSFEGSTVGKVQSDPESGRIIRVNRAFADMLGYTPEALVGRLGKELVWPGDLEQQQEDHYGVVNGDITHYVRERRYLHRDGSFVWGRVSASIIRNRSNGRPDLSIGVVENIHEQHATREGLRRVALELERTVEERGAALVQRDLLLREVYHRVKNNLQIVDSLLVMQSRALTDPAARAGLASLRSRVFALGLVHTQLMGSDNLQTFDIAPFLQELSCNLARAGAGNIHLTVHAEPLDVGLDFAIPLGLLVTELVTNALKHAFPEGPGEVRVTLSPAEGGLSLVVADNGCGYAPDETAPRTGLGGRIIRGLLGQLGGVMTVTREGGTQCHIQLPPPAPLEALQ